MYLNYVDPVEVSEDLHHVFIDGGTQLVIITKTVSVTKANGQEVVFIKLFGPKWPALDDIFRILDIPKDRCISVYENGFEMTFILKGDK